MDSLLQASDPRTPLPVLLQLAADHPAEVSANPTLSRHPASLKGAELFSLLSLAACTQAPRALLQQLACHARCEVRATVAQNAACTPRLLALLAFDDDGEVSETARRNPSAPPALEALMAGTPVAWREQMRSWLMNEELHILRHAYCPTALLVYLGRLGGELTLAALANPSLPDPVVGELLASWPGGLPRPVFSLLESSALRLHGPSAEKRLQVPPLVALRLLRGCEVEPTFLLNLFSSRVLLRGLTCSAPKDNELLALIDTALNHPTCDRALLRRMSGHRLALVRAEAARHPLLPPSRLLRLLGDPVYPVRRAAWYSGKLKPAWRERLLRLGFTAGLPALPARQELTDDDRQALRAAGLWLKGWRCRGEGGAGQGAAGVRSRGGA